MAQLRSAAPPPLLLEVALTIARLNRAWPPTTAGRARATKLCIDPTLELLFVCETTLPGQPPGLEPLTQPDLTGLYLRRARLLPLASGAAGSCPLSYLVSGQCFFTTASHKELVASFTPSQVQAGGVELNVQSGLNLLEYLRAERFTVELSGTLRRRFLRPLPLRLHLELEARQGLRA